MTIQEALRILNNYNGDRQMYQWRATQAAELSRSYCNETKELDEKIEKLNKKIEKLKADKSIAEEMKSEILDRYVDIEMEKYEQMRVEARKVVAAADRLIAEEMKREEH